MINQFSGAVFDQHRAYRFVLWRFWDERPRMLFVGLNPSTASEYQDDPTISRLCGFAKEWGYGGPYACNLFGFVSANPKHLADAEAVHKANYPAIRMASGLSALTVAGWGDGIKQVPNGHIVAAHVREEYLDTPMCFGLTKRGNPKHPLYLPGDTELVDYHTARNGGSDES